MLDVVIALRAEVQALRQRMRTLEDEVATLRGVVRVDRDEAKLERIVPAIAEAVDDRTFTGRELLDTYQSRNAGLRQALCDAQMSDARELGQLLGRAARKGSAIAGFVVRQRTDYGRQNAGMAWSVCIAEVEYTNVLTENRQCEEDAKP